MLPLPTSRLSPFCPFLLGVYISGFWNAIFHESLQSLETPSYSCTQIHMRHLLPHVLSWPLTEIYTHDMTKNSQINFKKKDAFHQFCFFPLCLESPWKSLSSVLQFLTAPFQDLDPSCDWRITYQLGGLTCDFKDDYLYGFIPLEIINLSFITLRTPKQGPNPFGEFFSNFLGNFFPF